MYSHAPQGYTCPFCLIARGTEDGQLLTQPSDVVYRDELLTAFISAGQYLHNHGHCIIIPNQHYENIFDLPVEYGTPIQWLARALVLAMKEEYKCDGVSTRQHNEPAGNQDVWHYHLHVFPRYVEDDLYLTPRVLMPAAERAQYAARLRPRLSAP